MIQRAKFGLYEQRPIVDIETKRAIKRGISHISTRLPKQVVVTRITPFENGILNSRQVDSVIFHPYQGSVQNWTIMLEEVFLRKFRFVTKHISATTHTTEKAFSPGGTVVKKRK